MFLLEYYSQLDHLIKPRKQLYTEFFFEYKGNKYIYKIKAL